jgi:hypothetical protein
MRQPRLAPTLLALCLLHAPGLLAPATAAGNAVTPTELLAAPEKYLGRDVEVVIVEPLEGPSSAQALASVAYGQVGVGMPDGGPATLTLVPAAFRADDPNRYKNKFAQVLASPITVRGMFLLDDDLSAQIHRKHYVLRVASFEPIAPPAPRPVRALAEISAAPGQWDRQRIVYEGSYETRFEVSALDSRIWLGFTARTETVNAPASQASGTHRVRVTGYLFAKPGAKYGHMGGYDFELIADRIEFLAP